MTETNSAASFRRNSTGGTRRRGLPSLQIELDAEKLHSLLSTGGQQEAIELVDNIRAAAGELTERLASAGSYAALSTSGQRRVVAYDIETLSTIEEAGGWDRHDRLGVSVLCAHDSATGNYLVFSDHLPEPWRTLYEARPLADFQSLADGAAAVVSFNGLRFDNRVLAFNGINIPEGRCYDLLIEGWIGQGLDPNPAGHPDEYKGGLNDYAKANLGAEKSGTGELAPIMWRDGRYREVIEYCLLDVRITATLFRLSQRQGWLDNPKTGKRAMFREA